jgi:hypothetical protein
VTKLREDVGEHVDNRQQPHRHKLHIHEERELEAHVAPIEAILHLLGVLTPSLEPLLVEDAEENLDLTEAVEGPTWLEAACAVLRGAGVEPMHVKDIMSAIRESDLRDLSTAKTPEATLRRDLRLDSQKPDGRVRQTAPATFSLR